jgi:flagellar basal-body rod modification protein FlgD
MTISSVSSSYVSAATTTASTTSTTATSGLSTSDFLQLIVAQLQNQNPLDPTDTTEFMNQLVSYASYDQQQTMNTNLSQLVTSMNSMLTSGGIGYIGQTVEAKGDTTTLQDGSASWGYSLSSNADTTTITVKDTSGNTVWSGSGETSSGSHTFTWDGTKSDGSTAASGDYTISVSAKNASGTSVLNYTTVIGKVTGVDSTSGTTQLVIGDTTVDLNNVINVKS